MLGPKSMDNLIKATTFKTPIFSAYLNTLFHTIDLQGTDSIGEWMHPQMVEGRRPPFSLLCRQKISNKIWLREESDNND